MWQPEVTCALFGSQTFFGAVNKVQTSPHSFMPRMKTIRYCSLNILWAKENFFSSTTNTVYILVLYAYSKKHVP